MDRNFDYIIAGSGLSGLSLLYRLLKEPELKQKQILVIDNAVKNKNDRTWCFWEKSPGPFEELVIHRWKSLKFMSPEVSRQFEMKEYEYKMIQAGDFYPFVLEFAKGFPNVIFIQEQIKNISDEGNKAKVETTTGNYFAEYVFNSTPLFNPKMDESNTLLQHFMGWYIRTDQNIFDPDVGTLMDFTISQKDGAAFMYVLPTDQNEALVEYTLFTERLLEKEAYPQALEDYIQNTLGIAHYELIHSEFGVIPMSLARFRSSVGQNRRIINMGTAGGNTKPSTGYTFSFVQQYVDKIISRLKKNQYPAPALSIREKMFLWYDQTLLDVLISGKMSVKGIFTMLFKRLDPERILAFLVNESGFWEEFKIRNSVPQWPFITSGIKQLLGVGKK